MVICGSHVIKHCCNFTLNSELLSHVVIIPLCFKDCVQKEKVVQNIFNESYMMKQMIM